MAIISAADLKSYIGLDADDSEDDTQITNAVNAANSAVVNYCGRNFDTATSSTRVYYPVHSHLVDTLRYGDEFTELTTLKTDTSDNGTYDTTWDSSDYILEPLNGVVDGETVPYYRIRSVEAKTFPTTGHRPSVQIAAEFGWSSVPGPVTQAALLLAARLFKRKDSPFGSLGFDDFALRITREDPETRTLLMAYKARPVLV